MPIIGKKKEMTTVGKSTAANLLYGVYLNEPLNTSFTWSDLPHAALSNISGFIEKRHPHDKPL